MSVIFQSFKDYTINHSHMIIKNNKHDIKNSCQNVIIIIIFFI